MTELMLGKGNFALERMGFIDLIIHCIFEGDPGQQSSLYRRVTGLRIYLFSTLSLSIKVHASFRF